MKGVDLHRKMFRSADRLVGIICGLGKMWLDHDMILVALTYNKGMNFILQAPGKPKLYCKSILET